MNKSVDPSATSVSSLLQQVSRFPESPGVYLMKNRADVPVYIGKAINLRSRVRSYFSTSHDDRPHIPFMLRNVDHIDWIATNNETEALILEANLIRKHQPKYNVDLRDDKHFPYLKVTLQEPFPRLLVTRRVAHDGARYFGPYTDVTSMRRMAAFAKKIFLLRDCKRTLPASRPIRPCINYSMKKCGAPCAGKISQSDYRNKVNDLLRFLSGKRNDLLAELTERMENASAGLQFEQAAAIRDQIKLIRDASRLQQVDLRLDDSDCDVFGLAHAQRGTCLAVLRFREGLLTNSHHFLFPATAWSHANPSHDNLFLQFYLSRGDDPPPLIFIPDTVGFSQQTLQEWVKQKFIRHIDILVPQKGARRLLLAMAEKNARLYLLQKDTHDDVQDCADLQKALALPFYPQTIEAFDISNLGSSFAVAGMVQFVDGHPNRSAYRRYKIKTVDGQNDFAMMMEVVKRRLERLMAEGKPFPDLFLIDGGPGQLGSAVKALGAFKSPPVTISLAKQEELIYLPDRSDPIRLPPNHPGRKLVERIRDEVHRHAITYHRKLRGRQFYSSNLERIDGVGKRRAAMLLKKFGSMKRLREASAEEIARLPGISEAMATKIKQALTAS